LFFFFVLILFVLANTFFLIQGASLEKKIKDKFFPTYKRKEYKTIKRFIFFLKCDQLKNLLLKYVIYSNHFIFLLILSCIFSFILFYAFNIKFFFLFFNHLNISIYSFLIILFLLIFLQIFYYLIYYSIISENILNYEVIILFNYASLALIFSLFTINLISLFILLEIFIYCIFIIIPLQYNILYTVEIPHGLFIKNDAVDEERKKKVLAMIKLQQLTNYIFPTEFSLQKNYLKIEATIKYFLYSSFNSFFYIFGLINLLYCNVHLNFSSLSVIFQKNIQSLVTLNIALIPQNNFYLYISVYCFLIFFLFKLSIFPFHIWVFDLFQGVSYIVLNFITVPGKIVFIVLFIQFFYGKFFDLFIYSWQNLVLTFCVITAIISAFGLLRQNDIKRFIAYSTLNHMSYIVLGVCFNTFSGFYAVIVYLCAYMLMMQLFFLIILLLYNKYTKLPLLQVTSLKALRTGSPLFLWIFAMNIFSFIGVPPFAGFWGKFYILYSLLEQVILNFNNNSDNFYFLVLILFILIVTSIISGVAYFFFLRIIFFEKFTNVNQNITLKLNKYSFGFFHIFILISLFLFLTLFGFIFFENQYVISFIHDFVQLYFFIMKQ
jgi:NADH-quinone oxidoreductase subunit N